jgi:hypothetical protein
MKEEDLKEFPGNSYNEKLYNYEHNNKELPKCVCGQPLKFICRTEGYRKFCSNKCRSENYKTKNPCNQKEKWKKIKETLKEKYGVDSCAKIHTTEERSEFCKGKRTKKGEEIRKEKWLQQKEQIKEKKRKTNIEKYGTLEVFDAKRKDILSTRKKNYIEKLFNSDKIKDIVEPLFDVKKEYDGGLNNDGRVLYYKFKCKKCGKEFQDYLANGNVPKCNYCYPSPAGSYFELQMRNWIENWLRIPCLFNNREIIAPLELDFYFPEQKVAIELNGIYWHSEKISKGIKNENYHLEKYNKCKEKGIKLLQFWDLEWFSKKPIVKSMIRASLGGKDFRKINARNCIVKEVEIKESESFLENNHIQGFNGGEFKFGLYTKENELVAVLIIGKSRFNKECFEIIRYSSLINTFVRGGLTKLFNYIKENYLPKNYKLISYVDKRFFEGKSNELLGLKLNSESYPAYFYTKDYKTLEHRMLYQKKLLKKKFPEIYQEELTEWNIMQLAGFDRVWDCGQYKYTNFLN